MSTNIVPKSVANLEKISLENNQRRKEEEAEENEDEKIKIGKDIDLTELDVHSVFPGPTELKKEGVWDEIEILPLA